MGAPNTAPIIVVVCNGSIAYVAANKRHPPASSVKPVFIPTIPSALSNIFVFVIIPAIGSSARFSETIERNTGSFRTRCPTTISSDAVLTVAG